MKARIELLREVVNGFTANTAEELESLRIKYLSKKGEISELFNDFRSVPNEDKRAIGQFLNQLRAAAQENLNGLMAMLESQNADSELIIYGRARGIIAVNLGTD